MRSQLSMLIAMLYSMCFGPFQCLDEISPFNVYFNCEQARFWCIFGLLGALKYKISSFNLYLNAVYATLWCISGLLGAVKDEISSFSAYFGILQHAICSFQGPYSPRLVEPRRAQMCIAWVLVHFRLLGAIGKEISSFSVYLNVLSAAFYFTAPASFEG